MIFAYCLLAFGLAIDGASNVQYQLRSLARTEVCAQQDGNRLVVASCDETNRVKRTQVIRLEPRLKSQKHLLRLDSGQCLQRSGTSGNCRGSTNNSFNFDLSLSNGRIVTRIVHAVGKKTKFCLAVLDNKLAFRKCSQQPSQKFLLKHLEEDAIEKLTQTSSADAFDPTIFRSYNFALDPIDLEILNRDPAAEKYVPCNVTTDYGTDKQMVWTMAGCRYKGSVGALRICLDANNKLTNQCRKLSIKVDSNQFRSDKQKIFGLKKFNFHGMPADWSLMKERFAYTSMIEAGIPSPRAMHVKIFVNGRYTGIYTLIESLDDQFVERNLGSSSKDNALYKHPFIPTAGLQKDAKKYLKAGKHEEDFLQQVATALQAAKGEDFSDQDKALALLEKYFVVENLVNVTAMNDALGAWDDWRNFFNNHYWMISDTESGKRLLMVPWDYDRIGGFNLFASVGPIPWYTCPCEDDSGNVLKQAGTSCDQMIAAFGCDVDLSTISPEAPQGMLLKSLCSKSCKECGKQASGTRRRLLQTQAPAMDNVKGPVNGCKDDMNGELKKFGVTCSGIKMLGCDMDLGSLSPDYKGVLGRSLCPGSCEKVCQSDKFCACHFKKGICINEKEAPICSDSETSPNWCRTCQRIEDWDMNGCEENFRKHLANMRCDTFFANAGFNRTVKVGSSVRLVPTPTEMMMTFEAAVQGGSSGGGIVNCNPFTQLVGASLKDRIQTRAQEFATFLQSRLALLDRWKDQILDSVATDPDGPDTERWNSGIQGFYQDLVNARDDIGKTCDEQSIRTGCTAPSFPTSPLQV